MKKIDIREFYELFHRDTQVEYNKLVNIRGCNGSGKSTIPICMMNADPYTYEITWRVQGKERVLATVFPTFHFAALGHYHSKCGGMDSMKTTDEIKAAVEVLWNLDVNILMEGIMASTVRQTYIDLFQGLNTKYSSTRDIIIFNILPPLEVCLQRIQQRNGGKPIKEEMVASKWATVEKNISHFQNAGFRCIKADNSGVLMSETLEWFFALVNPGDSINKQNKQEPEVLEMLKPQRRKTNLKSRFPKYDGEPEEIYRPKHSEITGYEWTPYYKEPNDKVIINWTNMKIYWYWISERMNIWYKRTILREPQPWTNDPIFQEGKFTNAVRDLDKGTIYYIKNILSKIDEPFDDFEKRQKEIIINTMIYRTFIKKETMDSIGFIYLDTWNEQWEQAKRKIRAIRDSGETVFHGAYFVYSFHAASPSPEIHDKVENALNLIENFWYPNLDEIYKKVTTCNMEDLLDYFTSLPCIGGFTAYEFICDWTLCHRHTKNKIVDWTDDSFVNIGPGNKKGLEFIFENGGNLSDIEKDIYLRATWKHYMKRYGYYSKFMSQLPQFMNKDLSLRVIEHDCCEVSKYLTVYYGLGHFKNKFTNDSQNNLDELIL